jgi:hypothetical protein
MDSPSPENQQLWAVLNFLHEHGFSAAEGELLRELQARKLEEHEVVSLDKGSSGALSPAGLTRTATGSNSLGNLLRCARGCWRVALRFSTPALRLKLLTCARLLAPWPGLLAVR